MKYHKKLSLGSSKIPVERKHALKVENLNELYNAMNQSNNSVTLIERALTMMILLIENLHI